MEALAFLTDYPIRRMEDFEADGNGDEFSLKCLRYMGDSPSFPWEEAVVHERPRRGYLYLELIGENWIPLYPFIVPMTSSHRKVAETYFIDAWDRRRNTARMKSFERGHTISSSEVSDSLAEWEDTDEASASSQ